MSVLIKHMAMPKGCIYANDNDQTEYCPLLNHDDVPFCQYIKSDPEIVIGIGERPVYCPLSDVPEPCENTVSRQAAIDALGTPHGILYPIRTVEELPSVQPEIIRCKDCRFQDKGLNESESWNLCGYRPWLHVPTEDEHYCGYAKRRTEHGSD